MSRARTFAAVLLLVVVAACERTSSPLPLEPRFAKGGSSAVRVEATDPSEAPQDTTLDVRIIGSGFEPGSQATFLLGGAPNPGIATNRTRFLSETELVAEVTIALDATVALYDVEVSSSHGRRRGVGTELFAVVEKTNGGPTEGDVVTTFDDSAEMAVTSDGGGGYVTIEKQKRVTSEIQAGRHWLEMGPRARRTLCWSFPEAGPDAQILSAVDWQDLVAVSGGAIGLGQRYCGFTTMFTRDHSDPDKLPGMDTDPATPMDDVQTAGGKMILDELSVSGDWEWRLFFDDYRTTINGGDRQNGVCIRRNADETWTIGNDAGLDDTSEHPGECDGVDEYVNLFRAGGPSGDFVLVARFRMPFRYTLIPLF